MKEKIVYFATIIFSILYIFVANKMILKGESFFDADEASRLVLSQVEEIMDTEEDGYGGISTKFKAKLLEGKEKGKEVNAEQLLDSYSSVNHIELKENDKIYLYKHEDQGEINWYADQYNRSSGLIILGIVFVLFVILFGRKKGINTIVALIFTCLSVFLVYIPAILTGRNIYAWSIITCIYIAVSTLLIVQGATKKSMVALIGCLSGTTISGILTLIMSKVLSLTGMLNEESLYLYYLNEQSPIDLKAIIFGSIIVGAIGAIMDVSIDIASSLNEVTNALENPTFDKIVKSGFEIGRDIIGTMANTLVLAYIGSSLSCTLLTITYSGSLIQLLNREMIVVELLQSLVGSLGIFLTIPLTTYISAFLYLDYHKRKKKRFLNSGEDKKKKITKETFLEDPFK